MAKSSEISTLDFNNFPVDLTLILINFSKSNSRLLIEGPYGVGKKLIANQIHQNSKYKEKIPLKIDFST